MKSERIYLAIILAIGLELIFVSNLLGQGEMVNFRARFLYKNQVISERIGGRIAGGGSFLTDSNGEISMQVTQTEEVQLMLTEENWLILYPKDGRVPIPRNEYTFAQIILAHPGESDNSAAILSRLTSLQSSQTKNRELVLQEINLLKDSLANIFDQKTLDAVQQQLFVYEQIRQENLKQDSILQAKEKLITQEGRLEMLGLITSSLDHFITRAKDLRDEFEVSGKKSLLNGSAVEELSGRIISYSEAYEKLNQNENKIKDLLGTYWQKDLTIFKTESLLDFALNDVHKQTILSARDLINDIRNYRDPRVKKKNKRRKAEIEKDISQFVLDLNNHIDELTDRKSEVFQLLNEN